MKTAIYIEDGTVQLVLTPEGEFERNAISSFREKILTVKLFTGSFYDCRGGWIRQNEFHSDCLGNKNYDNSIILRILKEEDHDDNRTVDHNQERELPGLDQSA